VGQHHAIQIQHRDLQFAVNERALRPAEPRQRLVLASKMK
jgi:hypothetical protein